MELELKNKIGSLTANTTYVVSEDCELTENVALKENTTLIFKGGIIKGKYGNAYTLTGLNTCVVAPITQIFDTTVTVNGSWKIDRAYPQWFGAKANLKSFDDNANMDCTDAINNAIKMKSTGEVFLPRGYYRINKTIQVKNGIVLIGEMGVHQNAGEVIREEIRGAVLVAGAVPIGGKTALEQYKDDFLMRINLDDNADLEVENSAPVTIVRNLRFLNTWKKIGNLKCISVGGPFELDNCYFKLFKQVVYTIKSYKPKDKDERTSSYFDLKKIVNCTTAEAGEIDDEGKGITHSGDPLYLFDLDGLGDALVFQHNGIHDTKDGQKALSLNQCNGGIITSNIINNDVFIKNSKGITFNSNHLEYGAQVLIQNSNVTSMNNFFEKGTRPNLVVKSLNEGNASVVKSMGDLFLFYDKRNRTNIKQVSEYDVQISNFSSFEVSQSYRYWVNTGVIGRMNIFGIAVCKENMSPLTDFNTQSHLLSSDSRIMSGFNVINTAYVDGLLKPTCYASGQNSHAVWEKSSGRYYYKYQILWDRKRKIAGNSGLLSWKVNDVTYNYIDMRQDGNGLLLHMNAGNADECGNQVMIRLFRGTSTDYSEYVDIPVTGTSYLYDNGFSICGFRWKALSSNDVEKLPNVNTNISSIRYKGKNIECRATSLPTQGDWTDGDIVYERGNVWIRNGSSWLGNIPEVPEAPKASETPDKISGDLSGWVNFFKLKKSTDPFKRRNILLSISSCFYGGQVSVATISIPYGGSSAPFLVNSGKSGSQSVEFKYVYDAEYLKLYINTGNNRVHTLKVLQSDLSADNYDLNVSAATPPSGAIQFGVI